jgi:hypothetical protein
MICHSEHSQNVAGIHVSTNISSISAYFIAFKANTNFSYSSASFIHFNIYNKL